MKTILLACNAGMSTSMLVLRMNEVAKQQALDVSIEAVPLTEIANHTAHNEIGVILVGPQVKFMIPDLKKRYEPEIPVESIDMRAYGMMDGEKVLKEALKYMGE